LKNTTKTIFVLIAVIFYQFNFDIVFSISPSYDRFEKEDNQNDFRFATPNDKNANDSSSCKVIDYIKGNETYPYFLPDIVALNVFSDGKNLNYTAWFNKPIGNKLENHSVSVIPVITIDVEKTKDNNSASLENYTNNLVKDLRANNNDFNLLEKKSTIISEEKAEKIKYSLINFLTNQKEIITRYLMISNGNLYDIIQYGPFEKYSKDIDGIINSFNPHLANPIDQEGKPENQSLYVNDENNFSMYIPNNWNVSKSTFGFNDIEVYPPTETIKELGRQYELTLDILQKNNEGVDFVERILWDVDTKSWTRLVTERPGSHEEYMKVIQEQHNITDFYHNQNHSQIISDLLKEKKPNYVTSSVDLRHFGYPSKYGVIFGIIDIYQINDTICKVLDIVGPIPLPPPYFFINLNPRTLNLYPNDEANVELNFTTNTPWNWNVTFNTNSTKDVKTTISPNETLLIGDSKYTTKAHVKVLQNASVDMPLIPVTAKAQLSGITLTLPYEYNYYPQEQSIVYTETATMKVNVLKPIPPENPFVNAVMESISSGEIWKYLVGAFATLGVIFTKKIKNAKKSSKQQSIKKWFAKKKP
jgi:hypothetical protein